MAFTKTNIKTGEMVTANVPPTKDQVEEILTTIADGDPFNPEDGEAEPTDDQSSQDDQKTVTEETSDGATDTTPKLDADRTTALTKEGTKVAEKLGFNVVDEDGQQLAVDPDTGDKYHVSDIGLFDEGRRREREQTDGEPSTRTVTTEDGAEREVISVPKDTVAAGWGGALSVDIYKDDFDEELPEWARQAVMEHGLDALDTTGLTPEQEFNRLQELGGYGPDMRFLPSGEIVDQAFLDGLPEWALQAVKEHGLDALDMTGLTPEQEFNRLQELGAYGPDMRFLPSGDIVDQAFLDGLPAAALEAVMEQGLDALGTDGLDPRAAFDRRQQLGLYGPDDIFAGTDDAREVISFPAPPDDMPEEQRRAYLDSVRYRSYSEDILRQIIDDPQSSEHDRATAIAELERRARAPFSAASPETLRAILDDPQTVDADFIGAAADLRRRHTKLVELPSGEAISQADFDELPELAREAIMAQGLAALDMSGLEPPVQFNRMQELGYFPADSTFAGIADDGSFLSFPAPPEHLSEQERQEYLDSVRYRGYSDEVLHILATDHEVSVHDRATASAERERRTRNLVELKSGETIYQDEFDQLPELAQQAVMEQGIDALDMTGLDDRAEFRRLQQLGFFGEDDIYAGRNEAGDFIAYSPPPFDDSPTGASMREASTETLFAIIGAPEVPRDQWAAALAELDRRAVIEASVSRAGLEATLLDPEAPAIDLTKAEGLVAAREASALDLLAAREAAAAEDILLDPQASPADVASAQLKLGESTPMGGYDDDDRAESIWRRKENAWIDLNVALNSPEDERPSAEEIARLKQAAQYQPEESEFIEQYGHLQFASIARRVAHEKRDILSQKQREGEAISPHDYLSRAEQVHASGPNWSDTLDALLWTTPLPFTKGWGIIAATPVGRAATSYIRPLVAPALRPVVGAVQSTAKTATKNALDQLRRLVRQAPVPPPPGGKVRTSDPLTFLLEGVPWRAPGATIARESNRILGQLETMFAKHGGALRALEEFRKISPHQAVGSFLKATTKNPTSPDHWQYIPGRWLAQELKRLEASVAQSRKQLFEMQRKLGDQLQRLAEAQGSGGAGWGLLGQKIKRDALDITKAFENEITNPPLPTPSYTRSWLLREGPVSKRALAKTQLDDSMLLPGQAHGGAGVGRTLGSPRGSGWGPGTGPIGAIAAKTAASQGTTASAPARSLPFALPIGSMSALWSGADVSSRAQSSSQSLIRPGETESIQQVVPTLVPNPFTGIPTVSPVVDPVPLSFPVPVPVIQPTPTTRTTPTTIPTPETSPVPVLEPLPEIEPLREPSHPPRPARPITIPATVPEGAPIPGTTPAPEPVPETGPKRRTSRTRTRPAPPTTTPAVPSVVPPVRTSPRRVAVPGPNFGTSPEGTPDPDDAPHGFERVPDATPSRKTSVAIDLDVVPAIQVNPRPDTPTAVSASPTLPPTRRPSGTSDIPGTPTGAPSLATKRDRLPGRPATFPELVAAKAGFGYRIFDMDAGTSRFVLDRPPGVPAESGEGAAHRSHTVLSYDDDPPDQRDIDMGAFSVRVSRDGLKYRPKNRERRRGGRRGNNKRERLA